MLGARCVSCEGRVAGGRWGLSQQEAQLLAICEPPTATVSHGDHAVDPLKPHRRRSGMGRLPTFPTATMPWTH